jgi:hypothetical protein
MRDKNKVYSPPRPPCRGDLVGGVEEGGELSGHYSYGVVDLVKCARVTGLVLGNSDQFMGSMAITFALGGAGP